MGLVGFAILDLSLSVWVVVGGVFGLMLIVLILIMFGFSFCVVF